MSHIAITVDYLVDRLTPVLTPSGFVVLDGPSGQAPAGATKVVVIGGAYQPIDTTRPAAGSVITAGPGNASDYELISVACQAFSQTGDADATSLRDRRTDTFGVLQAIRLYLVGDRTLGGIAQGDARIGSVDDTRPVRGTRGTGVVVDFTITCTALLWDG